MEQKEAQAFQERKEKEALLDQRVIVAQRVLWDP
jgi:hypothetical protein